MNQQRRTFIKNVGLTALGAAFLPQLRAGTVAPSDKLRVAHIGLGGMGNAHMNWFAGLPEVDIVALCDVDEAPLKKTKAALTKLQPKNKATTYTDFRKILERKDIDAITCATPDHWHAQIAGLAFMAGKDVYGEKPLSYDVHEGQKMLELANSHNRIFQMGNQIHAGDNFHRVVELIQSGVIGKVSQVRLWKTGDSPKLGSPGVEKIPAGLNWDMWLGPAPYVDYIPAKCHFNYRYFLDYSGGMFADFWCHIADVVYWSLNPQGLHKIHARGVAPEGIADAPVTMDVDYEFEDGFKILWTSKAPDVPGAAKRGIGAYFEGDKGTLICDYSTRELVINGEVMQDVESVAQSIPRSPGHQQNFVDGVKNRTQPESNLAYARKMTLPMHLGLISYRLNRPLEWNEQLETFIGDEEANALLFRQPRDKWNLIKI